MPWPPSCTWCLQEKTQGQPSWEVTGWKEPLTYQQVVPGLEVLAWTFGSSVDTRKQAGMLHVTGSRAARTGKGKVKCHWFSTCRQGHLQALGWIKVPLIICLGLTKAWRSQRRRLLQPEPSLPWFGWAGFESRWWPHKSYLLHLAGTTWAVPASPPHCPDLLWRQEHSSHTATLTTAIKQGNVQWVFRCTCNQGRHWVSPPQHTVAKCWKMIKWFKLPLVRHKSWQQWLANPCLIKNTLNPNRPFLLAGQAVWIQCLFITP